MCPKGSISGPRVKVTAEHVRPPGLLFYHNFSSSGPRQPVVCWKTNDFGTRKACVELSRSLLPVTQSPQVASVVYVCNIFHGGWFQQIAGVSLWGRRVPCQLKQQIKDSSVVLNTCLGEFHDDFTEYLRNWYMRIISNIDWITKLKDLYLYCPVMLACAGSRSVKLPIKWSLHTKNGHKSLHV